MDKFNRFLRRFEQKNTQLTPVEKYSIRLGWLGTGLIMTAPHLLPDPLGVKLYIIAGIVSLPQVVVAKQWNLVLVNLNVSIAYIILLYHG